MLASPTSHKLRQSVVEAVVTRLSSLRIFVKASHSSYISCLDMFSRFISQVSDWTRGSTAEEPPASPSNTSNDSSNQLNSIRSTPSRTRSGHARQRSGNFSEVEFMDSGLGRSLTADLPVLGLQDELDALQFDDLFVEEYLLSRLQDAQRRLQEVREYMATLTEEELVSANRPPLPPNSSPNVSPIPGAPPVPTKRSRRSERLFVASFRLPLTVEITPEGDIKSSISSGSIGLVSAFKDLLGRLPIRWLGAPAQTYQVGAEMLSHERQKMERHFRTRHRRTAGLLSYVPLFPDDSDAAAHKEFCNSVMWPLFHYIPLNYAGDKMYQVDMFEAYERINRFYAEALIEEWKRSGTDESQAMFWIHDFHLFLVPKILRDRLPNAKIGFSLHTPFPAGEVFRALAPRKELLEGLLGADLLGFHTYDYARHFLSVCERLLGLTAKPNAVDNKGVFVKVGIYPFGIDAATFRTAMKQSKVQELRNEIRESYSGKKVIIGVDRLDYIKGIPHKLLAIEHFLETHPEWIGNVVFLQVTTPSRAATEEYQILRSEILEMVGRINGRFASIEDMPIHYREYTMTFEELCALYSAADVALITSLRDGMNLVSYEYIMCQKDRNGVLILSEFTGAAQSLPGALLVNPWNVEEVSDAIYQSLEMPDFERELKHQKLYRHVIMHTASAWGVSFIDDLVKYSAERREKFKQLVELPSQEIVESYRAAKGKRLLFLDYDGTLRKYESQPELAEPTQILKENLKRLTSCDKNIVFIVTGRQKSTVLDWLGETGAGFAVEHGFSLRWPDHLRERFGGPQSGDDQLGLEEGLHRNGTAEVVTEEGRDNTWDDLMSPQDLIAMRHALDLAGNLLRRIEDCTPTSFLSRKESAYSWHFRDADPDFAVSRAHDARQALEEVLAGSPMEVLMGQKILYVRPKGVHKGAAVAHILQSLDQENEWPAWVLSIGDDRTDEDMFTELYRSSKNREMVVNTCTVGRKTTAAEYYVDSVDDVLDLLSILSPP